MLLEKEMENESGELQRLEEELTEWKTQKEPEPEQPECVQKNRSLLKEKGIPYQQFYKTIEFGTGMESQQADRLEEALQQMGILDALIISEEYRDASHFSNAWLSIAIRSAGVSYFLAFKSRCSTGNFFHSVSIFSMASPSKSSFCPLK